MSANKQCSMNVEEQSSQDKYSAKDIVKNFNNQSTSTAKKEQSLKLNDNEDQENNSGLINRKSPGNLVLPVTLSLSSFL